jgi:predicted nucleotidyltransferase
MLERDRYVLETFANHVRDRFSEARIWAFGSRAHGTASPESDLDVCVVIEHLDEESDGQVMDVAWQVGFENDVVISTVTYSRVEFEIGPLSESALVQAVRREGIAA